MNYNSMEHLLYSYSTPCEYISTIGLNMPLQYSRHVLCKNIAIYLVEFGWQQNEIYITF